ncbi:MAG: hypothetical protein BGO31_13840 [Bacteroidetes bacterium 43-16]|nr:MAG: hypothetical protein BGO31_13840 [Bacteroidetes bacterium 43-16]
MKVLIIEDELPAFKRLEKLIRELVPEVAIFGPVDSVQAAQAWFRDNAAPDVLFTDIQLADGNTFDFIKIVRPSCPIIFTTAYNEYALQAFDTTGLDYLLKPIKREDLNRALNKLRNLKDFFQQDKSEALNTGFRQRFMVRFGDHIKSIATEEIAYFYSENKTTFLKTSNGKAYPIDSNLDSLEQQTDPQQFFRLNRQFLASLSAIADIKVHTKGRVILALQPEAKEAPVVSSEKSATFKHWISGKG